jgi:hypothetical protein
MTSNRPGRLVLVVGSLAVAIAFAALPASGASTGQVTVFTGRFVCDVGGEQLPLVGSTVSLDLVGHAGSSGFLGLGGTGDVFGAPGVANGLTGPDGEFHLEVPFLSDSNQDYAVRLALDGPGRVVVRDWPSSAPASFSTGTNENDVPVQDYHTQVFPGDECRVWLAFDAARANYQAITGKGSPEIDVNYDGPNSGDPWTDYLTVQWPRGYAADSFDAQKVAALHEFAHVIRNFGFGSAQRAAAELAGFDFMQRRNPCAQTGPRLAFYDGWAEFWAGDYAPAPSCPGVAETDQSVEGMVAWRLVRMERICTADSRGKMDEILAFEGRSVHSLQDFAALLPPCEPGLVNPSQISSTRHAPQVAPDRYANDLQSLREDAGSEVARIDAQLTDAQRPAANAKCPPTPCTKAIAARIAPAILAGELAQEHAVLHTLDAGVNPATVHRLGASFLENVLTTPTALTRTIAAIGATSLSNALAAAQPFLLADHSAASEALIAAVKRARSIDTLLTHGIPLTRNDASFTSALYDLLLPTLNKVRQAQRPQATHRLTHNLLNFGGLATGAVITSQVPGATFGSAQALHFPGTAPAHACAAAPTAQHAGPALAPACPDPNLTGYVTAGLLARLASPAENVSVRVGATQTLPGGFPVELDGFDAAGKLVSQDGALVGGSSYTQGTGLATTLMIGADHARTIVFVAVFVNSYWRQGPDLIFDDLGYTGM